MHCICIVLTLYPLNKTINQNSMNTTNTTAAQVEALSNGYKLPTQDLIKLVGVDPAVTSAFAHAHPVSNSKCDFLHYGVLMHPDRFAITAEQKEQAKTHYARMKQNAIDGVGNKLVFVAMGMDYAARYEDDVCNHRIRTEILAPNGNKYFIEVGTWGNELTRFDHVIDRTQQDEYEEMRRKYSDKIESMGGWQRVSAEHPARVGYDKYSKQPHQWYKLEDWQSKRMKYTKTNILNIVNHLFGCNFKEIEICSHFLTTSDYTSVSPNKEA